MPHGRLSLVDQVRCVYRETVCNRIVRGRVLWEQFETVAAACDGEPYDRSLIERINELAIAKLLIEDEHLREPIEYEPYLLPDDRKIDFVAARGQENIYVEVKTVHPRAVDTEASWQNYLRRRQHHPDNVQFVTEQQWMGGAIYGNVFASRSHFLEYTLEFEARLAPAKATREGPGILVFAGSGFAWHLSDLEDFVDFYHSGAHRQDDPFALMERHHIERENLRLLRNVDHFACLRRPVELPEVERFTFPVHGPRIGAPNRVA